MSCLLDSFFLSHCANMVDAYCVMAETSTELGVGALIERWSKLLSFLSVSWSGFDLCADNVKYSLFFSRATNLK